MVIDPGSPSKTWGHKGSTPAWVRVTPRHICDESRNPRQGETDRLLIKPTRWARPASAPQEDKSTSRHAETARSAQSHSQAPPPILAQPPPRPTHQHSQIRADEVDPREHRGRHQESTDPQIGRTTVNGSDQRWSLIDLSGVRNGAGRAMRR